MSEVSVITQAQLHTTFHELTNNTDLTEKICITYIDGGLNIKHFTYKDVIEACKVISDELSAIRENLKENTIGTGIICDNLLIIPCMLASMEHGYFMNISPNNPHTYTESVVSRAHLQILIVFGDEMELKSYRVYSEIIVCKMKLKILTTSCSTLQENKYAYVIATSGSTGVPKLVFVPHHCISTNVEDFISLFDISKKDVILSVSPFTFDPSIIDVFMALHSGARIIMLYHTIPKQPDALQNVIKEQNPCILQATPSLVRSLNKDFLRTYLLAAISPLKILALGGEQFPIELKDFVSHDNKTIFFNLYGLTEVSCWASYYRMTSADIININNSNEIMKVPIGKPFRGVNISLLSDGNDSALKEIVLAGQRVNCHILGVKYHKQNELLTGDFAWEKNGEIYFECRLDNIVKRNGLRVSLEEIEGNAHNIKGVCNASAIWYFGKIWLCVKQFPKFTLQSSKSLEIFLPSWKLPDHIIEINDWPQNAHGKTNKKALLENIIRIEGDSCTYSSQRDLISQLWKKYLDVNTISADANFIMCGGNSLKAVLFVENVSHTLKKDYPELLTITLNRSFEDICSYVSSTTGGDEDSEAPVQKKPKLIINMKKKVTINSGESSRQTEEVSSSFIVKWKFNLGKCIDATPLFFQNKIYIGSHSKRFVCLESDTGKVTWETTLPDRIEASVALSSDDNEIYVGCYDCNLYCLNISDGRKKWKITTDGIIKSTTITVNNCVFFGSYDKHVYLGSRDGNIIWRKCFTNGSILSTPLAKDSLIYVGTLDGFLFCVNSVTGMLLWKSHVGKPIFSSLAFHEDGIVFGCVDSYIYSYSLNGDLQWRFCTGAPVFSSPTVLNSIVIIGSHDHLIYVLDTSGNYLQKIELQSPIYSVPCAFSLTDDSIMICVTESKGILSAYAFNLKNQTISKYLTYHFPNETFSSPVIEWPYVYVGCRDDHIYCLEIPQ